ncbi:DODA-type extradiol aromatic ring-opening family dioxygenase [Xanthomonas translucens]|uniref:DODA-type extradiol aromatic ring-opening family dioxygenase n=1 Tax=Xanthomonas campestris pv. translucens TaxID=343 RepID=UPI00071E93D9|nr:class III extradiol ring-cleavage dioxygenase [Xanthomonas translucens]QEN94944.1 dioxygenase [Xanthomonas translucens pv. undulosa]
MPRLPSLYISHGSPMTALDPGLVGVRLAELAAALPRPRAIVVASAHWLGRRPLVGAAAQPQTIHDFGGFPRALHEMQYPAPGAPALAREVATQLERAGLQPYVDARRGLDHGVWVPLSLLYPQADIPVVPLSIQPELGPAHQLALGRALAPLRDEGVLLIGSGSITHNLHDVGRYAEGKDAPYVRPFIDWVEQALRREDLAALLDYRRQAPFAERAHPTDEHWLPIYFAMGAAGAEGLAAQRIDAGIDAGLLAMDLYRFDGGAQRAAPEPAGPATA